MDYYKKYIKYKNKYIKYKKMIGGNILEKQIFSLCEDINNTQDHNVKNDKISNLLNNEYDTINLRNLEYSEIEIIIIMLRDNFNYIRTIPGIYSNRNILCHMLFYNNIYITYKHTNDITLLYSFVEPYYYNYIENNSNEFMDYNSCLILLFNEELVNFYGEFENTTDRDFLIIFFDIVITSLYDHNFNINYQDKNTGSTIIHKLVKYNSSFFMDINIEMLIEILSEKNIGYNFDFNLFDNNYYLVFDYLFLYILYTVINEYDTELDNKIQIIKYLIDQIDIERTIYINKKTSNNIIIYNKSDIIIKNTNDDEYNHKITMGDLIINEKIFKYSNQILKSLPYNFDLSMVENFTDSVVRYIQKRNPKNLKTIFYERILENDSKSYFISGHGATDVSYFVVPENVTIIGLVTLNRTLDYFNELIWKNKIYGFSHMFLENYLKAKNFYDTVIYPSGYIMQNIIVSFNQSRHNNWFFSGIINDENFNKSLDEQDIKKRIDDKIKELNLNISQDNNLFNKSNYNLYLSTLFNDTVIADPLVDTYYFGRPVLSNIVHKIKEVNPNKKITIYVGTCRTCNNSSFNNLLGTCNIENIDNIINMIVDKYMEEQTGGNRKLVRRYSMSLGKSIMNETLDDIENFDYSNENNIVNTIRKILQNERLLKSVIYILENNNNGFLSNINENTLQTIYDRIERQEQIYDEDICIMAFYISIYKKIDSSK